MKEEKKEAKVPKRVGEGPLPEMPRPDDKKAMLYAHLREKAAKRKGK